jgi:hypothetical protein
MVKKKKVPKKVSKPSKIPGAGATNSSASSASSSAGGNFDPKSTDFPKNSSAAGGDSFDPNNVTELPKLDITGDDENSVITDEEDDSEESTDSNDITESKARAIGTVVEHKFNVSDLFYYIQMTNPRNTWTLKSTGDPSASGGISVSGILMSDEYGASISNGFDNQAFSDPIGQEVGSIFNTIKGYTPYINEIEKQGANAFSGLKNAVKSLAGKEVVDPKTKKAKVNDAGDIVTDITGSGLGEAANVAYEGINTAINLANLGWGKAKDFYSQITGGHSLVADLNGTFMSGFDLTKVYTGSQVDLQLPQLETTILSGSGVPGSGNIKAYVNAIIDKCLGDLNGFGMGDNSMWGILASPNSYVPDFANLDSNRPVEGAWSLTFGSHKVYNLLVTNFSYSYSSIKVRGTKDTPLYVTLRFSVIPAKWVGKNILKKFNGG